MPETASYWIFLRDRELLATQSWHSERRRVGAASRYVLVQLPEPLDPANKEQKHAAEFCHKLGKPRTIAELTKERLRRAAKKIKDENPGVRG